MKKVLLVLSLVLIFGTSVFGVTADEFVQAVKDNDIDLLKQYIDTGINVDIVNSEGVRALEAASTSGYLEIVKFLVDKGSNIHAKSDVGGGAWTDITPLICAIGGSIHNPTECTEVVKYLISKKADVNYKMKVMFNSILGVTPLAMAVLINQVDIVKILINAKANVNVSLSVGRESFTLIDLAYINGHTEIGNILRDAGAKGVYY